MGGEATENSWSRHCHKVLGSLWVGRTSVPEAVIDKMQAYPAPKDVKGARASVEIWGGFGGLLSPSGAKSLSLMLPS